MSQTLFTNARLIDPDAGTDTMGALLVEDGRIKEISTQAAENAGFSFTSVIPDSVVRVDCKGNCLAPGIVDIGVKVGEPGERHKES